MINSKTYPEMKAMSGEKESKNEEREAHEEGTEQIDRTEEVGQTEEMPGPIRNPPLLHRMPNMGIPPQDRIIIKKMKKIQKDMGDIKNYLKEILETLKVQEK
ncbi:hypothetical protein AKJ41_00840 [candidate division MSBL1 archaeon SCGC-AAA259O05]|uniref:Uncharacterized protein n=1 Tax=candidate division MSBL1 archaeon SCGC-AAA259O05 TaxID=1698271 RepID=A0A133V5A8_9EURY|nr:hypothetical protein AKJ41_00840 [candidate division MSBL1 archaeon SCGC-AAA259O05]